MIYHGGIFFWWAQGFRNVIRQKGGEQEIILRRMWIADLITFPGAEYGDDKDDLYPPEIWHDQGVCLLHVWPRCCLQYLTGGLMIKERLFMPSTRKWGPDLVWHVWKHRHWLVLLEAYSWNSGTLHHPLCAHAVKAYSCVNGVQMHHKKSQKKRRAKNLPAVFYPFLPTCAIWRRGFNKEVESTNCRISAVKVRRGVAQEEDIMGHKITANNPARNVRRVARIYGWNFFWRSEGKKKKDEESRPQWHFAVLSGEVRALAVQRVFVLTWKKIERKTTTKKKTVSRLLSE